jgi:hypothetical protein
VHLTTNSHSWTLAVYDVERNILAIYDPINPGMDLTEDKKEFRERPKHFWQTCNPILGLVRSGHLPGMTSS